MRKTIQTITAAALLLVATGALAGKTVQAEPDALTSASAVAPEDGEGVITPQDLKAEDVYGVWTNPVGIAAYGSAEQLEAAGGKATTDEIGEGISRMMASMGGADDFALVLTADSIMEANLMGRVVGGSYAVAGSTITVSAEGQTFSFEANVNKKERKLKLFYPVSAIPEQMSQFFTRYNIDGLYLGVELTGK